jgi:phosphatidylserine decarboxylase
MTNLLSRTFVWLQYLLPKHLLTALVWRLARMRNVSVKNFLMRQFVRHYDVDVSDLVHPVPDGYATFNDFFIRELAADARPLDSNTNSIVSPVDGTVSAAGRIDQHLVFQAKGLDYSLTDLLATDTADAEQYIDGAFATIYLAPYNYHRVHSPVDAELIAARYVPGALYSVNEATVSHLPQLFVRNERLICHLRAASGPMILIFVGALNVGTINSRWSGDLRPRRNGVVEEIDLRASDEETKLTKGDTMGWFNMGSTVILLLPPQDSDPFTSIVAGQKVRMGEAIGHLNGEQ